MPHDDQTGPLPPDRSYELFATGTPAMVPDPMRRRFYFGGNIYEGWSTVPEQHKLPGFGRPERRTFEIFSFSW